MIPRLLDIILCQFIKSEQLGYVLFRFPSVKDAHLGIFEPCERNFSCGKILQFCKIVVAFQLSIKLLIPCLIWCKLFSCAPIITGFIVSNICATGNWSQTFEGYPTRNWFVERSKNPMATTSESSSQSAKDSFNCTCKQIYTRCSNWCRNVGIDRNNDFNKTRSKSESYSVGNIVNTPFPWALFHCPSLLSKTTVKTSLSVPNRKLC